MTPKEFGNKIGKSVNTLQRWDRNGILKAGRTPTNRRYYTQEQVDEYFCIEKSDERVNVIYAIESTANQKDDLKNQVDFLKAYTNSKGIITEDAITDIGSGLNYKRKKWNKLLERVINREIDTIYIAYPDCFIRFGYEWFEKMCQYYGTKIVVVNNHDLSPEQELTEDLINIIHVFSCRSYGLRKYSKEIKGGSK